MAPFGTQTDKEITLDLLPDFCNCRGLFHEVVGFHHIPGDRIWVETDAPFILPYCKDVIQPKLLRRTRNTSMILPEVIKRIVELKDIHADVVEQTTGNVIRVFKLSI